MHESAASSSAPQLVFRWADDEDVDIYDSDPSSVPGDVDAMRSSTE